MDFSFFEVREARGVGIDQVQEEGRGGSIVGEVELVAGWRGESFNTLLDNLYKDRCIATSIGVINVILVITIVILINI